ncbi:hypothetical protein BGY98DRAFT_63535 [Russula aff. rugulosa BPL654]|nr:hypothetical protein BGY98DRAFT_63535 [Russula aff. rugulosa BPL654]
MLDKRLSSRKSFRLPLHPYFGANFFITNHMVGIEKGTGEEYDHIMKMTTPTDLLYHGFPNEFSILLNCTSVLQFDDKPNYSHLRKLLRDLFTREGCQYDLYPTRVSSIAQDEVVGASPKATGGRCKVVRRMRAIHEPATDDASHRTWCRSIHFRVARDLRVAR